MGRTLVYPRVQKNAVHRMDSRGKNVLQMLGTVESTHEHQLIARHSYLRPAYYPFHHQRDSSRPRTFDLSSCFPSLI